jgi:hypothetical protein
LKNSAKGAKPRLALSYEFKAAVCGYNTLNSGFVWYAGKDFADVIVQHSDVGGQGFSLSQDLG